MAGIPGACTSLARPHRDRPGPRRGVGEGADRLSPPAERGWPGTKGVRTLATPAGGAEAARPAGDRGSDDHGITGIDRGDALPHPVDDPGRLVAEHHRQRHRVLTIEHVQVAVADSRGEHPERHLPRTGLTHFQFVGDDQVDAVPHGADGPDHQLAGRGVGGVRLRIKSARRRTTTSTISGWVKIQNRSSAAPSNMIAAA